MLCGSSLQLVEKPPRREASLEFRRAHAAE